LFVVVSELIHKNNIEKGLGTAIRTWSDTWKEAWCLPSFFKT